MSCLPAPQFRISTPAEFICQRAFREKRRYFLLPFPPIVHLFRALLLLLPLNLAASSSLARSGSGQQLATNNKHPSITLPLKLGKSHRQCCSGASLPFPPSRIISSVQSPSLRCVPKTSLGDERRAGGRSELSVLLNAGIVVSLPPQMHFSNYIFSNSAGTANNTTDGCKNLLTSFIGYNGDLKRPLNAGGKKGFCHFALRVVAEAIRSRHCFLFSWPDWGKRVERRRRRREEATIISRKKKKIDFSSSPTPKNVSAWEEAEFVWDFFA